MKKWLIWCLTVLAMVCLIPGIALNAKAESLYCRYCDKFTDCEILGYEKFDSSFHTLHIKCKSCSKENDVIDSKYSKHTDDGKTPTCTTGKTCALCGAEYGILGHDWGAWTPNYASNGTHTRRCKRCNAEETGSCSGGYATCDTLGMCNTCGGSYYGGHAWGEWSSASNGTHTRRCKRCNAEETGSCSGGYATCDTLGMCNTCGGSYYGGHAWGEWSSAGNGTHTRSCTNYCREVDTAKCTGGKATCSAKAVCVECGGEYGEKDPNNHDLVHFRAKAPTCTEIGWDAYDRCIRCGYTTRKELPAQHDLEQHAAKAPTCTEIGWDAYEACSRCDHTTRKELPALNHNLEQHEAKAPTCTEKGWDAYKTCSRLGCNYTTYQEIPALKHDLVHHNAQAATCTEIGWDAYKTCSRLGCNYTTYQEIPALKHDLVHHNAQAATCTEIGWDAYKTCSRLGCNYTTYQEIPALKHDLVHHDAQAATCTEKGWDAYDTCSRCNYTTYAELPALNHDYQAVTVEPTCETDGYTVFTCSRCKDSYTADPTDKLGHQFGAWSPNGTGAQSADCLRQGCAHTGSTDCRKFTFRTAEDETLTFCPVCGQAENAAQLEKIDAATAWTISGSLSAADVTARTNGEYLSVAFETAGSLTQPTGRVRLALPAGLLEGKKLVRIAPDGTQTELPFEAKNGKLIFTLDFVNSELPVMLFRLVPQTAAL